MRPLPPGRGPPHTLLCRWIVFVVDHWSGAGLSYPNFLSILINPFAHAPRSLLKLRRQWQLDRARVALATFSLATVHFFARSGPDVVLGYRFRLSAANCHDLIDHGTICFSYYVYHILFYISS